MFSASGVREYAIELTISALEALLGGMRNMCTLLVIPLWSTMTQVPQFILGVALLFNLLAGGCYFVGISLEQSNIGAFVLRQGLLTGTCRNKGPEWPGVEWEDQG